MLQTLLVLSIFPAAEGAVPPPPGDDPCCVALTPISEVGASRGYSVSPRAVVFTGTRGGTVLEARCSAGHVEIALVEADGSVVSIDFVLALGYAAAGIWHARLADHESELEMMFERAIPSTDPRAKVDSDSVDAVQKCGVAFTLCLAAAWLPPAGAWACAAALGTCIAALPCLAGDCAGDGV